MIRLKSMSINLDSFGTEKRNPNTMNLDTLSVEQALIRMNNEDQKVPTAIKSVLPEIKKAIDLIVKQFNKSGRLIYMGAGTSGRLGLLDAVECVPTFGVSSKKVQGLIAGGEKAFIKAVEGAEDSVAMGGDDLKNVKLTPNDIVCGIAASGRTPYVIGGLNYAKSIGTPTIAIACNSNSEIGKCADIAIEVNLGPEFLTGSTRLKSGTAQKLILNMLSTISMIQIGKVYKNLMVDVQPTNEKLIERAKKIIMLSTDVDYDTASKKYYEADKNVKLAIVMILTGEIKEKATISLKKANGFIRKVGK
jgi:N-acetylmuramic acid 6-phosphate etherase